jgi:hypothetical protein
VDSPEELILKITTLKNMLVARATGEQCIDDYYEIRAGVMKHPLVKSRLPAFLATCRTLDEFWSFIKYEYAHYAERRNFIKDAFHPLLIHLEQLSNTPADATTTAGLTKVDSTHIQLAWHKALERRTSDPDGAITAARSLLESVCKHILDDRGVAYDDKADLPKLYGILAAELKLAPSQHTELVFKQILGGCHTVVEGLGAMRNKLGDAHGTGKRGVRPAPRHAELSVNLAGAVAMFLLQTWEARNANPTAK